MVDSNTENQPVMSPMLMDRGAPLGVSADTLGRMALHVKQDLTTLATNATLTQIKDAVDGLEGFTDGLEIIISSGNALLANIEDAVDGLEGLISASNTALSSIDSKASLFKTRSDTYTSVATGVAVDVTTGPLTRFAIQVKGTGGAPVLWDIRLEGSLDGVNYTQLIQHTNTDGDGTVKSTGSMGFPCLYFRSRATGSFTLGGASNIVATILGSQ